MITNPTEYAGLNKFIWFFGVAEDVQDPLYLGRVRVRCFGWHSDNLSEVPTTSLPWAQIMMPATSASVSGIGQSPTGILQGSWVLGFFLDGTRCQQPMVIGTFHGIPQTLPDSSKGFNDPEGMYPRTKDESDTNRLARTFVEAETHPSVIYKRAARTVDVPTAKIYSLEPSASDKPSSEYELLTWSEPDPINGQTIYPFNKVEESSSGHIHEVDDTPGCRRLHDYHAAGTFQEIQNDGTKIIKIVGDSYEVVVGNNHVVIHGACNVTIDGDTRLLVNGDCIEEVTGDQHVTVRGSRYTKIAGNDVTQIGGTDTTQVNGDGHYRVSRNATRTVGANETLNVGQERTTLIGGADTTFVTGKVLLTTSDYLLVATTDINISAGMKAALSAGTDLKLRNLSEVVASGNFSITASGTVDITTTGIVTVVGSLINLNP